MAFDESIDRLVEPHQPKRFGTDDDRRLSGFVSFDRDALPRAEVVIVGFPVDEGVRRNGGRVGAAGAPDAVRNALYRLTPNARFYAAFTDLLTRTVDIGNIRPGSSLEEAQEALGRVAAHVLSAGSTLVVLGGGHETSYGHFLGYVEANTPVYIVNIDAHADVRPLVDGRGHSGSPFRQALEHPSGSCVGYTVAGLQKSRVPRRHVEYLRNRKAGMYWREDLRSLSPETVFSATRSDSARMVTLDMDAIDVSFAPGVSAPSTNGLSVDEALAFAAAAGRDHLVRSLDIVETNPLYDHDTCTVRLAAALVWSFIDGLSQR